MIYQSARSGQVLMKSNLIVKHYAGSHAYGTNIETSDVDFRGIFCGDPINIRTPFYPVNEVEDILEEDTKLYELAHFMELALNCNPNIVETLWIDPTHIVTKTPAYDLLYAARYELMSKKIAFTTCGFALSQLKRIKGHNKWINNPAPVDPPQMKDFVSLVHNFTDVKMLKVDITEFQNNHRLVAFGSNTFGVFKAPGYKCYDNVGVLHSDFDGDSHTLGTPELIIKFNRDVYEHAMNAHSHYWEWKKNRNAKRSAIEEQFGYDCKHAMHLVRLLKMGAEVLQTGELQVFRKDADELLAIRNGAWTYDEVLKYAEHMDHQVREVLYAKSSLRKTPNIELAAKLTMEIQDMCWSQQ